MTTQVTWQTSNGKQATVTVELETSKTVSLDGDAFSVAACELTIIAKVEGMGVIGWGRPAAIKANGTTYQAIGNLVIPDEQLAEINAAIAAVEESPEWRAHLERQAQAEREAREYEAHREAMRRVMGY